MSSQAQLSNTEAVRIETTLAVSADQKPGRVELGRLNDVWIQVGGTLCNLTCKHCFISCSPENNSFDMMTLAQIRPYLRESEKLGVKEFYFTGGEPFLNPEMFEILHETLIIGSATVLTNGTIITRRRAQLLAEIVKQTENVLELRVSLDGFTAETNDALRGKGSFRLALKGITRLVEVGFSPIITAVQTWSDCENKRVVESARELLESIGYQKPRLKIIPALNLGAYHDNKIGSANGQIVTEKMMAGYDQSRLLCNGSRTVTSKGVYVCPILIDYPDARLGDSIAESEAAYTMKHPACHTCYLAGAICSNSCGQV